MNDVTHFECPDCKRDCRISITQRAVQHSLPECKTWSAHKGKAEEFLRLAMMAKGGAALNLGEVKIDADGPSPEERAKQKTELIDELNEGLKQL